MRNWMEASSKTIIKRFQDEVRLAGNLSCQCEHATYTERRKKLRRIKAHFDGALILIIILKERCLNSISTRLAMMFESMEIWVLEKLGMVDACLKYRRA